MALFTSENRQAWQNLADAHAKNRPSVGKTVTIIDGRKHKGKVGEVVWHGRDKFVSTQYWTEAQWALREIVGRYGYTVKVKTASGETFFVSADYTQVHYDACKYLTASDLWDGAV
jgi:hypothetical protein